MKTTNQTLYDKGLFDGFSDAVAILGDFLFVTRYIGKFEEVNDDIR